MQLSRHLPLAHSQRGKHETTQNKTTVRRIERRCHRAMVLAAMASPQTSPTATSQHPTPCEAAEKSQSSTYDSFSFTDCLAGSTLSPSTPPMGQLVVEQAAGACLTFLRVLVEWTCTL